MEPTKCLWDPHDLVGLLWIFTNQSKRVCWKMCVKMCVASIPSIIILMRVLGNIESKLKTCGSKIEPVNGQSGKPPKKIDFAC